MHLALALNGSSADFAPEPLTSDDMRRIQDEISFQASQVRSTLQNQMKRLRGSTAADARRLLERGDAALASITAAWTQPPAATKTRIHGDYHLGQVLWVDNDYVILDFEGEPTRPIEERRKKFSPIRDVAGMLRSYHYAAYAGLFAFTQDRHSDLLRLEPWADLWHQWVSAAFLAEYRQTATGASFVPPGDGDFARLFDAFTLAKALYELVYELNNRPDWVRIPLSGVLRLLGLDQQTT
jgi:maltose alpha-D-glucosyltransferase/alpha-amylase